MTKNPIKATIEINDGLASILERLKAAGAKPIIVGGAVRDAVMGQRHGKDIDIEVYGVPYEKIVASLADLGHVDLVGESYQVVNARVAGESYDISLPRRDSKVGSGHRGFEVEVDHTMSFEEASRRRDFCMNAMGWDPFEDELIDPHAGAADIAVGVLHLVDIDTFGDDPLRVLRGMQFAARFDMDLSGTTIAVCRELVNTYSELPVERVWGEWEKLLTLGVRPSNGIEVLEETRWLQHYPELEACYGIIQDPIWHPEGTVDEHIRQCVDRAAGVEDSDRLVAVLGALVHDFGKVTHTVIEPNGRITSKGHAEAGVEPAEAFMTRIGTPVGIINKILPIVREHMCIVNGPPNATRVRRLARRLYPATVFEWARVVEADRNGRGSASKIGETIPWKALALDCKVYKEPAKPILKGDVLIAIGMKPGPVFRLIIDASVEAQDGGKITDEESALRWLILYLADEPHDLDFFHYIDGLRNLAYRMGMEL